MLTWMKLRLGRVFALCTGLLAAMPASARAASLPTSYVDALQDALQADTSYRVRLQAAVLLGRSRASAAMGPLVEALARDPHLVVRAGAAMALGALHRTASLTPLCEQAARDPEPLVRQEALRALDAFTASEVAPALRKVYSGLPDKLQGPLLAGLMAAAQDASHARLQSLATKLLQDVREAHRPS